MFSFFISLIKYLFIYLFFHGYIYLLAKLELDVLLCIYMSYFNHYNESSISLYLTFTSLIACYL